MIYFNVSSLQTNNNKLAPYLSDLKRKPDVRAVSEAKLKENMIHSNIELDQGFSNFFVLRPHLRKEISTRPLDG